MAEAMLACCCGMVVLLALTFFFSFASIAPTEMGLKYNFVLKSVDPQAVTTPGLRFVGPFNSILRYPKTIQTLEYDKSHRDLLDGRTKDGLPLILGVAFQYRLLPEGLYQLYESFENLPGDFVSVYKLVGVHKITEEATKFTAYQFFNEKQKIAEQMRQGLDKYFRENLFATVESLQLNEDDLPQAFTDTILMAAISKQNITRMEKVKEAKMVEFATARLVAQAQANVTVQQAEGQKNKILQNGLADATIIETFVQAEKDAYSKIRHGMSLEKDDLLKYIWYDTLSGGGVGASTAGDAAGTQVKNMEVLFGVNPAAYISEGSSR